MSLLEDTGKKERSGEKMRVRRYRGQIPHHLSKKKKTQDEEKVDKRKECLNFSLNNQEI